MEDKIAIWECIEGLHQNMNLLGPKDIDFASSLLHSASTRGLSQKQEYWVRVLFERATKAAPQHKYIGDVSRLVEMLDEAAKRIKDSEARLTALIKAEQEFPPIDGARLETEGVTLTIRRN